ncbi:MAG: hypothetical protein HC801_08905 [Nitrospira sp.]|nr:hypothetical protein [Nitrospira sp.]
MKCILIRHGIAVERDEWEGTDENRPLTDRGKKRVRQAAAGLASLGCKPTHLYTSPFVRAYDTARLLRTMVCPGLKVETREELAVGANPEQLVNILQTLPSDAVVLCVGHEPFLGEVVSLFLCGKVLPNFLFKKAGPLASKWRVRVGRGSVGCAGGYHRYSYGFWASGHG